MEDNYCMRGNLCRLQNMAVGGHDEQYFGDLTDEAVVREQLTSAIEQTKEWHERELEQEQKRIEAEALANRHNDKNEEITASINSSDAQQYEKADTSFLTDPAYEQIMKGYKAIYDAEFEEKGTDFTEDMTAKGEIYIILEETDNSVKFLAYDRDSKNNKCGLYVYQSCIKGEDGSWSVQDAKILDIYAYVYDTNEVISSGRKAWADTGNEAYRKATGE